MTTSIALCTRRLRTVSPVVLALAVITTACARKDPPREDIPQYDALHDLDDAPAAVRSAANAVVRIRFAAGYATGSFISADGLLLTNNHVLGVDVCPREGCSFDLSFDQQRGGKPRPAMQVFGVPQHVDVGLDLAVVQVMDAPDGHRVSTPSFLTLHPVEAKALVGSTVYLVGHPEGHLKKWSSGQVAYASGEWIKTTAFALPGNSGSPILDDAGRIVGIDHHGPSSIDLVAAHGVDDYSIGTASAPIARALAAPLPATLRSTSDSVTQDDVVALHRLYLGAHVQNANLEGRPTPVLSIMAAACDKELGKGAFRSVEDFSQRTVACYQAHEWIDCGKDGAPAAATSCPMGDDKAAWTARFEALFHQNQALNGALWTSAITTCLAAMEPSQELATQVVRARLANLALENPPLDFNLASFLVAYDVDTFEGIAVSDFIRYYDRTPHYELEADAIAAAATWLVHYRRMTFDDFVDFSGRLQSDPSVSLGAKLAIDEYRWESGH